jgi:Asp-tRNA(Asn)/Glu-tRNA(Gln) amidotransferase C subunit
MPDPLAIDRALMMRLADQARLHLPPERLAALGARLERIVAAFGTLRAEAGAGAVADARVLPLRADVEGDPLPVETVLANAPQAAGGQFVVPRVIDA